MSNARQPATATKMQKYFQAAVTELHATVADMKHDDAIFKKYRVKKYKLKKKDEPVEVWIFNSESKPFPILEDQLMKRAESIYESAREIFNKTGTSSFFQTAGTDTSVRGGLSGLMGKFKEILNKEFYSKEIKDEKDFHAQYKRGKKLISNFINDIAYLYGGGGKYSFTKEEECAEFYAKFYKDLWETVEKTHPDYKRSHILVINENPQVRCVQYYERGEHPSAHNRAGIDVSNFIAFGTGYLDKEGWLHITDTGFRHASLPPIDLYKKEQEEIDLFEKQAKVIVRRSTVGEKNVRTSVSSDEKRVQEVIDNIHRDYQLQTVGITKKDMDILLHTEMKKYALDEKQTLNWVNVGLLTVTDDKEKQERQYRETILAAERIRGEEYIKISKDPSLRPAVNPIMFNFGVNWQARDKSLLAKIYPDEQKFENQRAFFQLQKIFYEQMQTTAKKMMADHPDSKNGNLIKIIVNIINELSKNQIDFEQKIEGVLKDYISKYAEAFNVFDGRGKSQRTEAEKNEVVKAEKELQAFKTYYYQEADTLLGKYRKEYHSSQLIENIEKLKEIAKDQREPAQQFLNALKDFQNINTFYLDDSWAKPEHNFKLQASIFNLAGQLSKLERYTESLSCTTRSLNCKSDNDRSNVASTFVDSVRALRQQPSISNVPFDREKHYSGSVFPLHPTYDTDGGGAKFGGRFDSGHPSRKFAAMQIATSGLATHKMKKKKRKIPTKFELGEIPQQEPAVRAQIR